MPSNDSFRRRITGLRLNLGNVRRPKIGSLFWWTIAIIILGISAVLSWTLSIYIFNHPSEPVPYKILTRLKKLPPPERFKIGAPPPGKFHTPRNLLEDEFAGLNKKHLQFANKILLRDYLENFRRSENVIYLSGDFIIDYLRPLNRNDLFSEGSVIRAHAEEFPNAIIEVVFPGSAAVASGAIKTGQPFRLSKTYFAALINVARQSEDFMCFTVVPIVYGKQTVPGGEISMHPPVELNIEGKWPLTSLSDVKENTPP